MPPIRVVPDEVLNQLRALDSCSVSNAIEQFQVRTRNEGYTRAPVRSLFPSLPPAVGYAVTGRIRTSSTPVVGRYYYQRLDWWSYVQSIPAPRFLVLEDIDTEPGLGALFGEIHANIANALSCVAFATNGTARDIAAVSAIGFPLFASGVSVSHAYAHIVDFGQEVVVGGLQIRPGNLLHGDQHGIISVPVGIAAEVPGVARKLLQSEQDLVRFCQSASFSAERLTEYIQRAAQESGLPDQDPIA